MSQNPNFYPGWYKYVTPNRRKEILEILSAISKLYQIQQLPLVIVGACSLLIRGCLQYKAWWDVDILFDSKENIKKFHELDKLNSIQVFPIDETIIDYGYLSSFQTMWGINNVWYRVDYIYRDNYYLFHTDSPHSTLLYQQQISWHRKKYTLNIPVAHPWNMFIDKLLSPRFEHELDYLENFSIDIRHIFILMSLFNEKPEFWKYIAAKAAELNATERLKKNLKSLLVSKEKLGYGTIQINYDQLKF